MLQYLNNIQSPSEEIIQSAYKSLRLRSIKSFSRYNLHYCDDVLLKFLKKNFSDRFNFGVQEIVDGQEIHVDHNRKTVFNYILDCGGEDVKTCFWSDLKGSKLLYEFNIEKFRWHMLNVTIPHSVKNIKTKRIAITVWT